METIKRLKESLGKLSSLVDDEPIILLKGQGNVWMNDKAKAMIMERNVNKDNLLSWLKIGAQHLKSASYCNIEVAMIRLPDSDDVLVLLRKECKPIQKTYDLTRKEKEILGCLIKGMTNKEIAACFSISSETVNTHLDSIYSKLGVSNRLAAALTAVKNGLAV